MFNDILNDKGLLDLLTKNNLAEGAEVQKILSLASEKNLTIYSAILESSLIAEEDLGRLISDSLKIPYVDLSHTEISDDVLKIIPHLYAKKHNIVAFNVDKEGLHVATINPNDESVKKQVEKKAGLSVIAHFATIGGINSALGHYEKGVVAAFDEIINKYVKETEKQKDVDPPVVKIVDTIIEYAFRNKASDIHIETQDENTIVRFRLDGILHDVVTLPGALHPNIVTRIKVMSNLRTDDHATPQDGKISFDIEGVDLDLRVSTVPTIEGEKVVIRLLFRDTGNLNLVDLGFSDSDLDKVVKAYKRPFGMILATGPTGSGKTTTLHSILKFLNTPDTKIWTAEDPVEITQKGLRQVQINKKAGIDFALVMRAFLRADPDIIMVGESRDKETVSMGVEASLTGHMVFSTLHTNSAPESITRLLDMGMDPFNFADALLGILAQRLAKKLCDCKQAYIPEAEELRLFAAEYAEELRHSQAWKADYAGESKKMVDKWLQTYGEGGQLKLYKAVGCDKCNGSGYKGRVGLHELMVADDAVKKLIQERARVAELFSAAVEGGMRTLKMDGMEKIMMGLTDLKMVRSVCIK